MGESLLICNLNNKSSYSFDPTHRVFDWVESLNPVADPVSTGKFGSYLETRQRLLASQDSFKGEFHPSRCASQDVTYLLPEMLFEGNPVHSGERRIYRYKP